MIQHDKNKKVPENLNILKQYKRQLQERLGINLVATLLFGSVARGTNTKESDIDVLVLVQNDDSRTREEVINGTFTMNLDNDVVISPLIVSVDEYNSPGFRETHLYQAISKEGITF